MAESARRRTGAGGPAWNAGEQVGAARLEGQADLVNPLFLGKEGRMRERALFDLVIDSKLGGCDLLVAAPICVICGSWEANAGSGRLIVLLGGLSAETNLVRHQQ